jgi:hypothetical protein
MTDYAKLAIQAETQGVTKAQGELDKLSTSAGKAETSTKKLTTQSGKAEKASSSFGGASRNLSFQLNQVAQQGAVTGNYLGALAIQLPDMLLSFGTLGILVGAAAGVMAGPLLTALSGASDGTEELDDKINDLIASLRSTKDEANETLLARLRLQAQEASEEIESLADVTKDLSGRQLRAIAAGEESRISRIKEIAEELVELEGKSATTNRARNAQSVQRRRLESELADLKGVEEERSNNILEIEGRRAKLLEAIAKLESDINKDTREVTQSNLDAENDALNDRLENFDKLRTAIINSNKTEKELAIQGASEVNSELALAYSNNIIDFNEYRSLRAEAQLNLQDELTAIEAKGASQRGQILSAEQQKTLGYTGQFFGNLADAAKEGGRKQFDNYKAMASAQALVSASLAVLGVLGDPSIPTIAKPVFASAIGGLAAVQVDAIYDQEYQGSYLGGGYTGTGSRSGGVDGKGGFPAILHPNETVIDHTMGQSIGGGSNNNVTVNVNIQSGVTKAELAGLLPSINQSVYNQVFAAINGGGTASQAVRRRA